MGKLDVLSIGSATEDVFVYLPDECMKRNTCVLYPGSKIEIEGMAYHTGGGATNTAVAFSRLGLKAGILCAVGDDESGAAVMAELGREKVDARKSLVMKGKNTAYSVILTARGKDRIVLCYSGATAMLNHAKIGPGSAGAEWIYVSSLHSEPALLRKISAHARTGDSKIVLNPGQAELALGIGALKRVFGRVSILLLNASEALRLTGSADIRRNLRRLTEIADIVAITEGSHGAHATDGKLAYFMKPFSVPIKDVTGAGDAFGSGFAAAIMKGHGVDEAIVWGTANASSVVMYMGTKNVLLTERALHKFVKKHSGRGNIVQVEEL
ncbi:MAG: carbohydrate kinase family protein [Candidatus Diapherotrites archaeon]|uniref:Carbohydrate kinase family protein n=1 Tax=Candidatus Iainarchaeum sp. TaxID=3101447 RepID=A0A8T3YIJ5_9ARCH|nr:carbohydrate kinase family protein [Candidatus Diapherotrites archaeon]